MEEHHLRDMLQKYIFGKISDIELSNWAAFVFMAQVYVPKGESEGERLRAGEGLVWDILQRLMSPTVFGMLSHQIAQNYLNLLT